MGSQTSRKHHDAGPLSGYCAPPGHVIVVSSALRRAHDIKFANFTVNDESIIVDVPKSLSDFRQNLVWRDRSVVCEIFRENMNDLEVCSIRYVEPSQQGTKLYWKVIDSEADWNNMLELKLLQF